MLLFYAWIYRAFLYSLLLTRLILPLWKHDGYLFFNEGSEQSKFSALNPWYIIISNHLFLTLMLKWLCCSKTNVPSSFNTASSCLHTVSSRSYTWCFSSVLCHLICRTEKKLTQCSGSVYKTIVLRLVQEYFPECWSGSTMQRTVLRFRCIFLLTINHSGPLSQKK